MAAMFTSALSAISCCCDDTPVAKSEPSCHSKKSDKPDTKEHHAKSEADKSDELTKCKSECDCVRVKSIQELPEFKSTVKKSESSVETANSGMLEKKEFVSFVVERPKFETDKIPKQQIAFSKASPRAPPCL